LLSLIKQNSQTSKNLKNKSLYYQANKHSNQQKITILILILLAPHTKYYSSDQIEKKDMGGACSTTGERRGLYRVLMGKPEEKRPLGRLRLRWEDYIKIHL
jgi:hypothetical protein